MGLLSGSPLKSTIKFFEVFFIFKTTLVYSKYFHLAKTPKPPAADAELIWLLYSFNSDNFLITWIGLRNLEFEQRDFSKKSVIAPEYCTGKIKLDSYIVSQNNLFSPNLGRLYRVSFSSEVGVEEGQ